MRISGVMGMLCVCGLAASAVAAPLTPGNLVVMKVGSMGTGSGEVVLSEYSKAGTALGNDIVIPFAGPNAISIPQITNHDRHIHRSVDGRLISFVGYNAAPDATDPSSLTAASTPRVVGLLDFHGNVDLSTKLNANYNATSIRGAATTDGSQIWTGGDNASGATPTGGTLYMTRGATLVNNISKVQTLGLTKTPDNIRDVGVYSGQLYNCSGSNSSVGKATFQVGIGLPTVGNQSLTTLNTDGASTSSFIMLDLDPSVPGPDVMYTAATVPTDCSHKYVKSGGVWVLKGQIDLPGIDQITAEANVDGGVTVYIASTSTVSVYHDPAPLTGSITGLTLTSIITPDTGYTLGGIALSTQFCVGDLNNDGLVDDADFVLFANAYNLLMCDDPTMPYPCPADFNSDGMVDDSDFVLFVNGYDALLCP
ncbi:MAG: hypothetical protein U0573_03415 [Phycisphaerales bacterium]|nr:hypothetical protein [Planctomycetota bacterium]